MAYFYWIAGVILALAWASRIVDAAIGMPSVANISLNQSGTAIRFSLLAIRKSRSSSPPATKSGDIEASLLSLLDLDYEQLRSDRRQRPLHRPDRRNHGGSSAVTSPDRKLAFAYIITANCPPAGWEKLTPCGAPPTPPRVIGSSSPTPTSCSSLIHFAAPSPTQKKLKRRPPRTVPPDDHEKPRRIHDDRFLSNHVRLRPSPLESRRSKIQRSHGRRRIQSDSPQRLPSQSAPTKPCAWKCWTT